MSAVAELRLNARGLSLSRILCMCYMRVLAYGAVRVSSPLVVQVTNKTAAIDQPQSGPRVTTRGARGVPELRRGSGSTGFISGRPQGPCLALPLRSLRPRSARSPSPRQMVKPSSMMAIQLLLLGSAARDRQVFRTYWCFRVPHETQRRAHAELHGGCRGCE